MVRTKTCNAVIPAIDSCTVASQGHVMVGAPHRPLSSTARLCPSSRQPLARLAFVSRHAHPCALPFTQSVSPLFTVRLVSRYHQQSLCSRPTTSLDSSDRTRAASNSLHLELIFSLNFIIILNSSLVPRYPVIFDVIAYPITTSTRQLWACCLLCLFCISLLLVSTSLCTRAKPFNSQSCDDSVGCGSPITCHLPPVQLLRGPISDI